MRCFGFVCFLFVLAVGPTLAGEMPESVEKAQLSDYMFGAAYLMAQNHDPDVEDACGFCFRRIYLTPRVRIQRDAWPTWPRLDPPARE